MYVSYIAPNFFRKIAVNFAHDILTTYAILFFAAYNWLKSRPYLRYMHVHVYMLDLPEQTIITPLQDSQPGTPLSTVEYPQDSDYIITPMDIKCTNAHEKALCFLDLSQLDEFVERLNEIRQCPEPACRGNLVPTSVKRGIGGAATITYNCDGCRGQELTLDTCKVQEDGRNSEITRALHVAFIISGCTFTTYTKVLRYLLGIQSTYDDRFQETIRIMHPVVKEMVDEMCTEAREAMKQMEPEELGSWERAVTVADGAWMTRGHHSKNFTFSIRNYFTSELLFRKHLCQKGGVNKDDLYKGTSKGAEGYAARILFQQAKEQGMKLAINWQVMVGRFILNGIISMIRH